MPFDENEHKGSSLCEESSETPCDARETALVGGVSAPVAQLDRAAVFGNTKARKTPENPGFLHFSLHQLYPSGLVRGCSRV
jgi:hypothetical protein